jgi:hypothetical protein
VFFNRKNLQKQTKWLSPCIRKRTNFSSAKHLNLIDTKKEENISQYKYFFEQNINFVSPKLTSLFQKIEDLDKQDRENYGKVFKHFIFTDVRSSLYGAKIIGSGFANKGFHLGFTSERIVKKKKDSLDEESFKKIELLSETELQKTAYDNFYILCSSGLFDQPISRELKKNLLQNFNERPNNIYGKNIRFIIMDSGYKEGIDLFDIKYIHIFEPQTTMADLKQVIGRGTRLCGQKGLDFHPTKGWELNVYIYDLNISKNLQPLFLNSKSAFDLYLKSLNYDVSLYNFQASLEETVIEGSVDYELNKNINKYVPVTTEEVTVHIGGNKKQKMPQSHNFIIDSESDSDEEDVVEKYEKKLNYSQMQKYINKYFKKFTWPKIKVENDCIDKPKTATPKSAEIEFPLIFPEREIIKGGNGINPTLVTYTKTQDFVRNFFTPQLHNKGILLWHSVGTGKTCTAIATATTTFEQQGYTILWVTRTTLVNDIWKNMFSQVCNENIRKKIQKENLEIPVMLNQQKKLLSKSWRIHPLSYKQFTNLVSKKNQFYKVLEKINGVEDPLRKTLLIIDEAHKLYGESDLLTNEKPNMEQLHAALMNSYAISGKQSVKLMLMTATPITKDPMELIQLLNLCKPLNEQLPVNFYSFKTEYLNEDGLFLGNKKKDFLDHIAGYISYLDRSNDVRQFAQPKLHYVDTNLIGEESLFINDKRGVRELDKFSKNEFKERKAIVKKEYTITRKLLKRAKKEFKSQVTNDMGIILDRFKTKKIRAKANKTVKKHINSSVKDLAIAFKEKIEDLKHKLKEKEKKFIDNFENPPDENAPLDDKFKLNVYYNLKYKCGKSINNKDLDIYFNSIPEIAAINDSIAAIQGDLDQLEQLTKENIKIHRTSIKQYKANKEMVDSFKKQIKDIKKSERKERTILTDNVKELSKEKKRTIKQYRKDLKKTISANIKTRKKELKEIAKRDKEVLVEYNENTRDLLQDKREGFEKEVEAELSNLLEEENELMNALQEKEALKVAKQAEKEALKAVKQAEKEALKEAKQAEKEVKDREKAQKRAEIDARKAAREAKKTAKNKTGGGNRRTRRRY